MAAGGGISFYREISSMPKREPRKPTRPALNIQIRDARLAAGMTQRDLGAELKVAQRFIWGLESGEKEPNVRHLIAICEATGCEFLIDSETVMFTAPG